MLSATEQSHGDLHQALRFALLGARLELGLPESPALARMQLASLVAQSPSKLNVPGFPRVQLAKMSTNAEFLFTFSYDRTARIWDTASSEEVTAGKRMESTVVAAAFSPDASKIAMATADGAMKIWEITTGATRTILAGGNFGAALTSTKFSPPALEPQKRPQFAGYSAETRKRRFVSKCVVADALQIEPVSTSNSLLTGKLTGNLQIQALCSGFGVQSASELNDFQRNSLRNGTGNFCRS